LIQFDQVRKTLLAIPASKLGDRACGVARVQLAEQRRGVEGRVPDVEK
jgi:hypothetical protein